VAEIEIGTGKSGRQAFGLEDVAIVPSRRTRDPEDVDLAWAIDAFHFGLPLLASAVDSVVSPATAIEIGRLGGLGVLNAEGLWGRYEDAEKVLEEIAGLPDEGATARLQAIYAEPVKPDLVAARIRQMKLAGVITAVAVTPQRTVALAKELVAAEVDLLVIQGTVVSAEHVARGGEPLNLKRFIRELPVPVLVGGCTSYQSALHLMRTGAAGVLVGVGSRDAVSVIDVLGIGVPQATAVADARGARMRHLDETGVYCHVIADGGMTTGGDLAKALALGADAVLIGSPLASAHEAPGRGYHWGMGAVHPSLPRGGRTEVGRRGSLEEILVGPSTEGDGRRNLFGSVRRAMAMTGHATLKEFQKADLVVR
jgi:IMP dehydrogenase